MAFHSLTFDELQTTVKHALAGSPDTRLPVEQVVNGALEYLVNLHAWSWRQAIATLDLVADTSTVVLPADFGQIVEIHSSSTSGNMLRPASIADVAKARINGYSVPNAFLYHLGMAAPATVASVPLRVLEIGPTPSASVTGAFVLVYRKLIPKLSATTDVPAIPYGMFEILRILCRAYAVSNEEQQAGHDWQLFNQMIGSYIAADAMAQGMVAGRLGNALCDLAADGAEVPLFATIKTAYD